MVKDVIRFEVEGEGEDWSRTVGIFINERNLLDMVREVELPFAESEEHPDLAGSYSGLPPKELLTASYLLTGGAAHFDGKTAVLGCTCGIVGCWPLLVRIILTENTVIWSDFEQWHRDSSPDGWNYNGFGPFVFDRGQYEDAFQLSQ